MAEEEKKEEPKKSKGVATYELVEVPTQMGLAVQTPEGEQITMDQALVRMMTDVAAIKKSIVG